MWRSIKEKVTEGIASCYLLTCLALLPSSVGAASWLTDLPSAQAAAKSENKIVLINFTGSDWCGWCIRLRNEVFSTPEFDAFARDNLVLMEADFPHHKAQSATDKRANEALAARFHISGFPTIIVLNGAGQQIGTLGYQPGGPQAFTAAISRVSGGKTATTTPPPLKEVPKNELPPAPLFNGAPTFPPQHFDQLVLKGISGLKNHRLAVINNKTLSPGESVLVKLKDSQVKLKCLEIREDSALVTVDGGEQRELRLRDGR